MKVLVAEDDQNIREGLAEILRREGYSVLHASDGAVALETWRREQPDIICLDVMMPKRSGYDVCKIIREENPDVPILFISAKTEEIDKVVGFEFGADDYIIKPFGVREVIARIRAVTRRCFAQKSEENNHLNLNPFTIGDIDVEPAQLRATRNGSPMNLSLRDIQFLTLFQKNPGRALDRPTIFREVWGVNHVPNSRTLDQHISSLRKRIEVDPKNPQIVKTVHGVGYRYDP